MKVGDLVKWNSRYFRVNVDKHRVGLIIGFEINYDRFGDPIEKVALVNWSGVNGISEEEDYMETLEVSNESW